MRKVLTDKAIRALKPAKPGQRYDVPDADVPGLIVRINDRGGRAFMFYGRFPLRHDRTTGAWLPNEARSPSRRAVGDYPDMPLAEAREIGREWRRLLRQGIDPQAEEDRRKREESQAVKATFGAVAEEYIRDHVIKKRKGKEVERDIRREFITRWGARPLTEVKRGDIIALVREVKGRGAPYQARNLLGYLKTFFAWCLEQDIYGLGSSPCDRIRSSRLIGEKVARQRVLNDEELRKIWEAAKVAGYAIGPIVQLLLLTAARKSEVAQARWAEMDLDRALWTIPPERTKTDAAHAIPLSLESVEILKAVPRWTKGDYVFSTTRGAMPVNSFSKAKDRLDRIIRETTGAALAPWRLHDLRRTARTHFSAIPAQDLVRELALGHVKPGLHRVYDQWAYLAEKRDLLDRWAKRLWAIVEPAPENVIPLRTATQ